MAATAAGVAALLILGNQWWNSEASNYSRIIYKPLQLAPKLEPGGRLILEIGWLAATEVGAMLGEWTDLEIKPDLAGIPRVIIAKRP